MDDYLVRPDALPTWGQRTALRLLNRAGWQFRFKPLPGPHGVAVVYPHTSNWDFPIGLLAKWAIGHQFRWMAKDSLFRGPMGVVMRYWGGVAVDRGNPQGIIRRLADQMRSAPWFWLVITPEGTRGYRPYWKSGFYRIARTAQVPVLLIALDYGKRVVDCTNVFVPTGDETADMAAIARIYEGVQARYPRDAAPVRLAPRDPDGAPQRA